MLKENEKKISFENRENLTIARISPKENYSKVNIYKKYILRF